MISQIAHRISTNGWRRAGIRFLMPVLAALLLFSQIQMAACPLTATGYEALGHAAFPICHSHSGDVLDRTGDDGHPLQHQEPCSACLIHCTAHALVTPTAHSHERTWIALQRTTLPVVVIRASIRYPAGASPRGPPQVA